MQFSVILLQNATCSDHENSRVQKMAEETRDQSFLQPSRVCSLKLVPSLQYREGASFPYFSLNPWEIWIHKLAASLDKSFLFFFI
jgi:hypothetical protein